MPFINLIQFYHI